MENIESHNTVNQIIDNTSKWRLCTAPMLDWTDRHYRYMARQITQYTRLYTEMVVSGAIIHGDKNRFLDFNPEEHPLALQLGGSDPNELAQCTRIAAQYGYDEVNLNCGCPSPRVQKGAFGACLMQEVDLVADCLKAMQDVTDIDITVKHRIGIDKIIDYHFVSDFVGTLYAKTQCQVYIVHSRNAWLQGLSPKENRDIPPLRYDFVYQLKKDFPMLTFVINGGIRNNEEIAQHLQHIDGVMIGREAYHHPMLMQNWDHLFFDDHHSSITYPELINKLYHYTQKQLQSGKGTMTRHIFRHYLNLLLNQYGAKIWRRTLSDSSLLRQNRAELILETWQRIQEASLSTQMKEYNES